MVVHEGRESGRAEVFTGCYLDIGSIEVPIRFYWLVRDVSGDNQPVRNSPTDPIRHNQAQPMLLFGCSRREDIRRAGVFMGCYHDIRSIVILQNG